MSWPVGIRSALAILVFGGLFLIGALGLAGCDDDAADPTHFPCGDQGGRCQIGVELCVIADGCSACVPLETPCAATDGCGCIAEVDHTAWDTPCADPPLCEPSGAGLLVRCSPDGWGCG